MNRAWAHSFPLFPKSKDGGFEMLRGEHRPLKQELSSGKGKEEGDTVSCQWGLKSNTPFRQMQYL